MPARRVSVPISQVKVSSALRKNDIGLSKVKVLLSRLAISRSAYYRGTLKISTVRRLAQLLQVDVREILADPEDDVLFSTTNDMDAETLLFAFEHAAEAYFWRDADAGKAAEYFYAVIERRIKPRIEHFNCWTFAIFFFQKDKELLRGHAQRFKDRLSPFALDLAEHLLTLKSRWPLPHLTRRPKQPAKGKP